MLGMSTVPETYQHIVGQVLQCIAGVHHIFNDIIVSGETTAQHDERLHQALQRLKEKQPLNGEKCQFRMMELECMFCPEILSQRLRQWKTHAIQQMLLR